MKINKWHPVVNMTHNFNYSNTYSLYIEGRWVEEYSDDPDWSKCSLYIDFMRTHIEIQLPSWICRPKCEKVYPVSWTEEDVKRLGRNWYNDYTTRRYGFNYYDGLLMSYYGIQTYDSSTEQNKGWFVPWMDWKFLKNEILDFQDYSVWDTQIGDQYFSSFNGSIDQAVWDDAKPCFKYDFIDYDGEWNTAICYVTRMHWTRGSGWWSWLSILIPNQVVTRLNIDYDRESGEDMGTWKGGTVSSTMPLDPNHGIYNTLIDHLISNNPDFKPIIGETKRYINTFHLNPFEDEIDLNKENE